MKLSTIFFSMLVSLLVFSTFACEKEAANTDNLYSAEAQRYFQILQQAEAEAEVSFSLSIADIEAALAQPLSYPKVEVCCYDALDLLALSSCFGLSTPACLAEWDFNGDGIINTADLLVLLANYGCPEVEAQLITPISLLVVDETSGQIRNETLIDGQAWYDNYGTEIFDQVRWYYDGVFVSSTPTHLQLEYPGATIFDAPIDCNGGNHLIELYVMVDCEVYSTSACIKLGIDEPLALCKTNYCSL